MYQETTNYGGEEHAGIMNQTFKWKVTLDGDKMTMTPVDDNPWNEVWQRVK